MYPDLTHAVQNMMSESVYDVPPLLRPKGWNSHQERENVGGEKMLNAFCDRVPGLFTKCFFFLEWPVGD